MLYNNGKIRTFPTQIGGTSWEPDLPNTAVIISKLEQFKTLLIEFYATDSDTKIIPYMKEHCIKRLRTKKIK